MSKSRVYNFWYTTLVFQVPKPGISQSGCSISPQKLVMIFMSWPNSIFGRQTYISTAIFSIVKTFNSQGSVPLPSSRTKKNSEKIDSYWYSEKVLSLDFTIYVFQSEFILIWHNRKCKFVDLKGTRVRLMSVTHQLLLTKLLSKSSDSMPRPLVWKFPPIIQFCPFKQIMKLEIKLTTLNSYLKNSIWETYQSVSPWPIINVHIFY